MILHIIDQGKASNMDHACSTATNVRFSQIPSGSLENADISGLQHVSLDGKRLLTVYHYNDSRDTLKSYQNCSLEIAVEAPANRPGTV